MLGIDTAMKIGIRQNQRERLNSCINDLLFMARSFEMLHEADIKACSEDFLERFVHNASKMVEAIGLDLDDISCSMNEYIEKNKQNK